MKSPFRLAAEHAEGAGYTVKYLIPQFEYDGLKRAGLREHLARRGGNEIEVMQVIDQKRAAAERALVAAERSIKALAIAYRELDPR